MAILLTSKNESKTYDLDKFQDIHTLHCRSIPISKYYFDSTFFSRVFRVFERKIVFFRKSQKRNLTYFRFHWLFLSLFFSGTNHPKHSLTHTHTHTHPHTHTHTHSHMDTHTNKRRHLTFCLSEESLKNFCPLEQTSVQQRTQQQNQIIFRKNLKHFSEKLL